MKLTIRPGGPTCGSGGARLFDIGLHGRAGVGGQGAGDEAGDRAVHARD